MTQQSLFTQRYLLQQKIGAGGFGEVWLALDTRLNRRKVALKRTPLQRQAQAQFLHEMNLLSRVSYPTLPHIYDFFVDGNESCIVMEYIEGVTLEEYLIQRQAPLSIQEVLTLGETLADTLWYLHDQGIIFRDMKPANVMIAPSGKEWRVFLIDFGIARLYKPGQAKDTQALGSPGYAAPEQYGRGQSSAQTDLYGLGATLYYALTLDDPADHPLQFDPLPQHVGALASFQFLLNQLTAYEAGNRPANALMVRDTLRDIATAPLTPQVSSPSSAPRLATGTSPTTKYQMVLVSSCLFAALDGEEYEDDVKLVKRVRKHLTPLERILSLTIYDGIPSGQDPGGTLAGYFAQVTHLIVLLSPNLVTSANAQPFLDLVEKRLLPTGCIVVPLLLKECEWEELYPQLAKYQALPHSRKYIDSVANKDSECTEVTKALRKLFV